MDKVKVKIGSRGPTCCGEPTHRVRFFDSIDHLEKANNDPSSEKGLMHVGYECRKCRKIRTAETEEDAALRFRTT